jgi:nicotinate phosphoribosyltransferase
MLESTALLTDLYQLTMLRAYFARGLTELAVFELFVRRLPAERAFLMAAGLEQALAFLASLRFTGDELAWVAARPGLGPALAERLAGLRFTGAVDAMPEGTVFFPDEPILRVTAPLPEAQLVESRLMNLLHFQTLIASKAARIVLTAPTKLLIDFGMRRSHGAEAGLLAARAAHLAGMAGTSTVLAGVRFGIPLYGTMSHAFVEAHDDEAEAFRDFARVHRQHVVLLLDTYDTERAAETVVAIAPELAGEGIAIEGVRLDSGDLAAHARRVRQILDAGGLRAVQILVSSNLDERAIAALLAAGAPIDGFAVGSRLDTSADAPYLDCAYKLQEYAGRPRRKRSEGKATRPGAKQVYRRYDRDGRIGEDVIALADDTRHDGEPLLRPVMRAGRCVGPSVSLADARAHAAAELATLPDALRRLDRSTAVLVRIAPSVSELMETCGPAAPSPRRRSRP